MALTITEKNHWKDRIAQRIDKRIDRLKCSNPKFFHDISEQAKAQAIKDAKVAKEIARLDEIKATEKALDAERNRLHRSVSCALFGKEKDYYSVRTEIDARIAELQRHVEEALLKEHEIGREISSLQAEKENLLDTVWLATSPRQVTDLWQKALKLLGEDTTEFQREVLSGKSADEQ